MKPFITILKTIKKIIQQITWVRPNIFFQFE